MRNLRILALSGSLRKASYNTALINAVSKLAPSGVDVVVYKGLGYLPLFNPDREQESIPEIIRLREELRKADGLLIASPEYAHGITGVLKNALDWLVSGEEFVNMPVALFNASPRATHAQAALREVVTTMSGIIIEQACISLPLLSSNLDADGIVCHTTMAKQIMEAMDALIAAIIDLP